MWFLLFEILVLMLLAAIAGGLIAFWWMKNRYEDVTESYQDLVSLRSQNDSAPSPVTREELETHLSGLYSSIVERLPDISPLSTRLETLDSRFADSGTAFEPVLARMAELETRIGQTRTTDMEGLEARLSRIEDGVNVVANAEPPEMPDVDFGPIHSGLARLELALESIDLPITDIDPLRSDLGQVETRLAEFAERLDAQRKADNESLTIRMQTLSSSLASMRIPDVDGLRERLSRLETSINTLVESKQDIGPITETLRQMERDLKTQAPPDDFRLMHNKLADLEGGTAALHAKLAALESHVSGLDRSPPDLSPVQSRLAHLDSSIASLRIDLQSLPDIAPFERRLGALQDSILSIQEPDVSGLMNSLRKVEARLNLSALEDRLTAIEYGLAAMHHMLRARQDASYTWPDNNEHDYRQRSSLPQTQEPPRAPVYTPPPQPPQSPPPPPPMAQPVPRPQRGETKQGGDPIAAARRPDDKANLLTEAAFGEEDDLERINGIGPMLCELLNEIGVYYFWQIAEWGPEEIDWVDAKLEHFKGRIQRDDWVGQAKQQAKRPEAARHP